MFTWRRKSDGLYFKKGNHWNHRWVADPADSTKYKLETNSTLWSLVPEAVHRDWGWQTPHEERLAHVKQYVAEHYDKVQLRVVVIEE